jgi:hypothetical protein
VPNANRIGQNLVQKKLRRSSTLWKNTVKLGPRDMAGSWATEKVLGNLRGKADGHRTTPLNKL